MACYLVTGGAGFIGSHLAEALVHRGNEVRVLDDLSTGARKNVTRLGDDATFYEGSICDEKLLRAAMDGVDYCLHEAALPSVPRSVADPVSTNSANVDGSLKVFLAARDAGVKRVVCASSSSVYGNGSAGPVDETAPLSPLSPYAVSKAADELYARACSDLYEIDIVCMRYFNVFGPRQDPNSPYAAVIPLFIDWMLAGKRPRVEGDGEQSRDFSFIDNVVEANLLACSVERPIAGVYNVACGETTTILELVRLLNELLGTRLEPEFVDARPGDVRCSWASIERARDTFGYAPGTSVRDGLERTVAWHRGI